MNYHRSRRDRTLHWYLDAKVNQNSLYHGVSVIIMIYKLIGLAPLSIIRAVPLSGRTYKGKRSKEPLISTQFKSSRIGCLYNFVLVILLLCIIYKSRDLVTSEYMSPTELAFSIELALAICDNTVVIVLWLILCAKQSVMVKILQRLMEVDRSIAYISGGVKPESSCRYFFILFAGSIVLWTIMIVFYQLCYDFPVIGTFIDCGPRLIIYWFMIQYVSAIKVIENRFRALRYVYQNRLTLFHQQTFTSLILEEIVLNKSHGNIIDVRRTHTVLCEITWNVSEFYSLPILMTIAVTCFSFVYNAYYIIVFLFANRNNNLLIYNTIHLTSWMIGLSLPIIMLTTGVNRTTAEMRKIADATHRLLESSAVSDKDKAELEQFSLKLLQRNDQFTACNIFSLDPTLLRSIFSMVITYLIILYQLQR